MMEGDKLEEALMNESATVVKAQAPECRRIAQGMGVSEPLRCKRRVTHVKSDIRYRCRSPVQTPPSTIPQLEW